jgi:membrane protein
MNWWEFTKKTWSEFSEDDCPTMAAALAYYTAFSLPSILLIVLFVAGVAFSREAVAGQIQQRIGATVGPGVASMVQGMLRSAARSTTGGTIATIFGIAGLMYAATNVLAQLQTAMNRAWEVKPAESGWTSMAKKRFTSFLLIVGVAILVLVSLGAATAATGLAGAAGIAFPGWLMYVLEIGISWVIFGFLFGVLFKALPDATVEWQDVKIGAFVTASLFIVGKFLIGFYLSHSTQASAYGAAGALALLLLWTYYSAMIFLFGVELTQVWARQHGRRIEPEPGAVKVTQQDTPRRVA